MVVFSESVLLDLVVLGVAIGAASYLAQVMKRTNKRDRILESRKHRVTEFKVYEKVYSWNFLTLWLLLIVEFFFSLIDDVFRQNDGTRLHVLVWLWVILFIPISAAQLYLLFKIFWKKK